MNYSSLMKADNDYQGASSSQDKRYMVNQQDYLKPTNKNCPNLSANNEEATRNSMHRNGSSSDVYETLETEGNVPVSNNEIRNRDITTAVQLQKKIKDNLSCISFLVHGIMLIGIVLCTAYVVTKWSEGSADKFHSQSVNTKEFKEKVLVILSLYNCKGHNQQTNIKVHLNRVDSVEIIESTPITIEAEARACVVNNTLYGVGLSSTYKKNQMWRWSPGAGTWARLADLPLSTSSHCVVSIGDKIYVLGGRVYSNSTVLDTVLVYNIKTNNWSLVAKLSHSVYVSACITYRNYIYVFGGLDSKDTNVNYVQILDTFTGIVSLSPYPMPSPQRLMKAVLWESKALLFGYNTSFIYDFHTNHWLIREEFKTNLTQFGLTLDGSTLYLSGGGIPLTNSNNQTIWTCSDEVKSLSVYDFILNRNVSWKHHAKLPAPSLVQSFSPEPLYVYASN